MDYQPLYEFSSTLSMRPLSWANGRQCMSASHALQCGHDPALSSKRVLLDGDCISLPGQINFPTNESQRTQHGEGSYGESNKSGKNTPNKNDNCETNESLGMTQCIEDSQGRSTDSSKDAELEECILSRNCPNNDNQDTLETRGSVLSQTNIHVSDSQHLGSQHSMISSFISNNVEELDNQSYLSSTCSSSGVLTSSTSPSESAIVQYKQNEPTGLQSTATRTTRPVTLVLYALCAIVVYPLLLVLVPFLLMFKLISILCCCIPCHRRKHKTQTANKQEFPLFFTSRPAGGYHTIAIELKERIDRETFIECVITKLNNVYCRENTVEQSVVFRLASMIRWIACFSWWELGENVSLEEHIQIVGKSITTTTNFTDFIEQLSRRESSGSRRKLWQLYYFPFFKTKSSAIVLKVHRSVLSGVNLKDLLLHVFSDSPQTVNNNSANYFADMPFAKPNIFEIFFTAPGIVLKHILRPSLSLILNSNKLRYAYSSPMHLSEACCIANQCNVSLHSLFLAPLSQTLRNLFSHKYPFGRVSVAIPVTNSTSGHNSAFFLNLPLTKQMWDTARLQQLDREIYRNSKDSYVLLSAAKLASLALSPCTVDFMASSIVRGADVLFHVIYCPNSTHYIEDYAVASVMYWPPLFHHISMSVCVVVYEKSIRVCVATDYSVTEWPDILLKQYIASYLELYRSFCT